MSTAVCQPNKQTTAWRSTADTADDLEQMLAVPAVLRGCGLAMAAATRLA